MRLLIRSLVLVLLSVSLYVVPASAQSYVFYNFYAYQDGNGNGYADYSGADTCLTGRLTVYKVNTGGGLSPFFYVDLLNAAPYTMNTWQQMMDCKTLSSRAYNILPNTVYRIQAFGAQTVFTTGSGSNPYYMGHRVP